MILTFHSLGVRILRESIDHLGYKQDFLIYDEEDADKLLKSCLAELDVKDQKLDTKSFKQMISRSKNALILPNQVKQSDLSTPAEQLFPKVYALYQAKLKQYNAVDFDDLLLLTVHLLQQHPDVLEMYQQRWHYLLIDEYQDTNAAQYALVRLIVQKNNNLFVVGDPDQSIYSWRGANIKNILNFEKDYQGARIVRLEQNYRSHTNILNAANALIQHNDNRYEKNLWSDLNPGEKVSLFTGMDDREEAAFVVDQIQFHHKQQKIPLSEMAVFYRTNFQSRIFEDQLLQRRIPYVIVGGISFYQRKEIKDILAFLRMVHSGSDYVSFSRTINIPKRGIGEATIEKIRLGAYHENISILEYCHALVDGYPLQNPVKLPAKQKEGLQSYVQCLQTLREVAKRGSLHKLVMETIDRTGYLDHLRLDQESFDDRRENLDALIAKALEWELAMEQEKEETTEPAKFLESFLEELSLKSTLDEASGSQDRVNLMTIHNGKGLEFKVTFLVGLEEDLFPHVNSKASSDAVEEERRLCYVGMTRAKEYLYISNSRMRFMWGTSRAMYPSRFLREIPAEYIQRVKGPSRITSHVKAPETEKPSFDTFPVGQVVFHRDFGIGVVQSMHQSSLGPTYEILFSKDQSKKNIVAQHAPLTAL
jgi:DNA helicase-2/ATP-dependent DNA helicase PcrA